ncbi:MAG: DUF362 domain-containing protein [Lachnospiraceae bacterium]|nr:DUF362 domain-containing protein [Lachnospiraceae bacterium]
MDKKEILVNHGTNYKEMTKELLEASDLIGRIPDRSCKVGIKPNLVSPSKASEGATTHPEVVAGIVEYLQMYGVNRIYIMEGAWVGAKTSEAVRVCGYDKLCRHYQVEFVDSQKDSWEKKDCKGMELAVCACADAVDFMINVPVLKGHCQTKITCALKNMKGLIPNAEKRRFHQMGLHRPIAHLAAGIRQDFIVVDHICGDLDFEDGGNPVVRNQVWTAVDPVLVDAWVCRMMGYRKEEVAYIGMAEELGVGCGDWTQAQVHEYKEGELSKVDFQDFSVPKSRKVVELQDAVEEVESCSACYGYLLPALDRLREEGLLSKLDTKICIGQGYKKQSGRLGIGNCTKGFTHCLPGCPPMPDEIYQFLKEYLLKL